MSTVTRSGMWHLLLSSILRICVRGGGGVNGAQGKMNLKFSDPINTLCASASWHSREDLRREKLLRVQRIHNHFWWKSQLFPYFPSSHSFISSSSSSSQIFWKQNAIRFTLHRHAWNSECGALLFSALDRSQLRVLS